VKHLVSFADSRMRRSLSRLSGQAESFGLFDTIHLLDEGSLSIDFRERFKDKLIAGSKGYGYWSWKPEVILNLLNEIDEGDHLLYIDAGCHMNTDGKKRLIEYFDILEKDNNGIVAFQAVQPTTENSSLKYDGRKLFDQPNHQYIKGDLLEYFDAKENPTIVNAQAIGAGIILIKKCDQALRIIKEWRKIIWERFDLLDDTPSISPNLPGFIENRHDQAIWTLLCLKHHVKTLSAYEYWYPKKNITKLKPDWSALHEFPIHAKRDKDLGFLRNSIWQFKLLIIKLKRISSKLKMIVSKDTQQC